MFGSKKQEAGKRCETQRLQMYRGSGEHFVQVGTQFAMNKFQWHSDKEDPVATNEGLVMDSITAYATTLLLLYSSTRL